MITFASIYCLFLKNSTYTFDVFSNTQIKFGIKTQNLCIYTSLVINYIWIHQQRVLPFGRAISDALAWHVDTSSQTRGRPGRTPDSKMASLLQQRQYLFILFRKVNFLSKNKMSNCYFFTGSLSIIFYLSAYQWCSQKGGGDLCPPPPKL